MINYNSPQQFLYVIIALICSACIAFTMTPIARVLAFKIGAVDIPKDSRRMHRGAMPLLGGVAIFIGIGQLIIGKIEKKEKEISESTPKAE